MGVRVWVRQAPRFPVMAVPRLGSGGRPGNRGNCGTLGSVAEFSRFVTAGMVGSGVRGKAGDRLSRGEAYRR